MADLVVRRSGDKVILDPIHVARAVVRQLGSVPEAAAHDDMISAATFAVWRFDVAHPDAKQSLRYWVGRLRAIDALRKWNGRRTRIMRVPLDEHINDWATEDPETPLTVAEVLDLRPRLATERDRQIVSAWLGGALGQDLAVEYSISEGRISMIISRWVRAA